ncbi:MAG: TrkA family potassium uptake protein [Spirochaetales bacterium]|nr:TrkA family potassium uptake protein [Spirochaetales bacterium]
MAKEKVFAVFGLGAFGNEVCRVLGEKGGKVIAFDNRPQPIEKIKDEVSQVMVLDSTDEDALRSAPLENVDIAIVAIGDDVEASILTTALLKNIGVPYIIARAVSDIHMRVLRQIGANEVINLEIEEGQRVASRLLTTEVLETIPVTEDYSIVELYVPESMAGKSLERLNLRQEYRVNVIAIERFKTNVDEEGNPVKEERVILPTKDDVLLTDDILILVGRNSDIEAFKEVS